MKANRQSSELHIFEGLTPTLQRGKPIESDWCLETRHVTARLAEPPAAVEAPRRPRVIRISQKFRLRWDLLTMLLAVYNCVTVPFFVAFSDDSDLAFLATNTSIDLIFLVDIVLNFFTTYIDKRGEEMLDPSLIAKNYLRKMFFIDLLASIPLDNFYIAFGNPGQLTTLVQLSDLLKLLRVLRLRRIIRFLRVRDQAKVLLKLLQLVFYLLLWVHFSACIWFLVVRESQSWVPVPELSAGRTELYSETVWKQYVVCAYHAVWLLVGGEVAPQNWPEALVAVLFLVIGAMMTAALLGEITILVGHLNRKQSELESLLDEAITITKTLKLPLELERKMIADIIEVQDSLNKQAEYDYFQDLVSPSLLRKVNLVVYEPIIKANYLMRLNERCRQLLMNNLQTKFAIPEEDLIVQGSGAHHVFFLIQGECHVSVDNRFRVREVVCVLEPGAHFGEVGVIYDIPRTASVTSRRYSTITQIEKVVFRSILKVYPLVLRELKRATVVYRDPWKEWVTQGLLAYPLFRFLDATALSELVYQMKSITLQPDEYLFRPGETCAGLFFVGEGLLELSFTFNSRSLQQDCRLKRSVEIVPLTKDGEVIGWVEPGEEGAYHTVGNYPVQLVLDVLKPQSLLNTDLSLITGTYQTQCKALEESTVYLITGKVLRKLSRDQPRFHKEGKKRAQTLLQLRQQQLLDPLDVVYPEQDPVKQQWKRAILKALIHKRRGSNRISMRMKGMLPKLHAAVLCQERDDFASADLVLNGDLPPTAVLEDGSVDDTSHKKEDPNMLLPSHPIIKGLRQFNGAVVCQNGDFFRHTRQMLQEARHANQRLLGAQQTIRTMREAIITHIRSLEDGLVMSRNRSSNQLKTELEGLLKKQERMKLQSSKVESDSFVFEFFD